MDWFPRLLIKTLQGALETDMVASLALLLVSVQVRYKCCSAVIAESYHCTYIITLVAGLSPAPLTVSQSVTDHDSVLQTLACMRRCTFASTADTTHNCLSCRFNAVAQSQFTLPTH